MVVGASVALVAGDARATLAFPLAVALQAPRPCTHGNAVMSVYLVTRRDRAYKLTDLVAFARRAVRVALPLVVVLPTPLAVRPVPVARAVQTVSTVPGPVVQVLVEEAPVRESVAVAFWKREIETS